MRCLSLLLCLNAAPLFAAAPRKAHPPSGLAIASIKIETHNVFETGAPPENKLVYKAANRIHIQTRDPVIERELLLAGSCLDPALAFEPRGVAFDRACKRLGARQEALLEMNER